MAVSLLLSPDGKSSLEFAADDIEAVRQAITHLFGEATCETRASYARAAFSGETFPFKYGWDDPCLIALTQAGSHLLTQIERRLSGTASQ